YGGFLVYETILRNLFLLTSIKNYVFHGKDNGREKYAVFNCLLIRSLCKLLFVLNFQLLKPAILFLFWDFYC
ncbi:MAG: hypothetical protein EGQ74_12515, partial [Bacteroides nordii]|nr:hypothetical protein [Bacteroides nordii]